MHSILFFFFFFNDTATTEIYTLSLHDALPIFIGRAVPRGHGVVQEREQRVAQLELYLVVQPPHHAEPQDRKSTRLNSSHGYISYAVFCLKKKKKKKKITDIYQSESVKAPIS